MGFAGSVFAFGTASILGGSWVVINGLISRVTMLTSHIRGLITPLITTRGPGAPESSRHFSKARGEDLGAQARDEPSKPASSSDWKCTPLPPAGSKSKHAKLRNPPFFAGHQLCGRLKLTCGSRMRLRGPTKALLFRMGRRETGSGHGHAAPLNQPFRVWGLGV